MSRLQESVLQGLFANERIFIQKTLLPRLWGRTVRIRVAKMPIFGVDEDMILERHATYEGGGGIKIPGRKKGTLFLTDRRILFEYGEGVISKKMFIPLNEPISKIRNVSGEGVISQKLVIELEKGSEERGYGRTGKVKFSMFGVSEWIREIRILITGSI